MAPCAVSQVHDITFQQDRLLAWALGLAIALLVLAVQSRRGRANAWVALGVGVMTMGAWMDVLAVAPDIVRTFCAQGNLNLVIPPGQVVPPESSFDLSGQYIGSILQRTGYVAAGALLVWRGRDPSWRSPSVPRIAAALRDLVPMRLGERLSLLAGVGLFPLLAVANVALERLTSGLQTGNDTQVFSRISLLQSILLALAAGVGEELVYRGVLQQGLKRAVGGLVRGRGGRWLGVAVGLLVQATLFGYAHAGYANLQHLLFAALFGLAMGGLVELFGLWTTIVLHFLIDSFALLAQTALTPAEGGYLFLLTVAVLAGTAWDLFLCARWVWRRRRAAAGQAP